jgi:hypothetical protein
VAAPSITAISIHHTVMVAPVVLVLSCTAISIAVAVGVLVLAEARLGVIPAVAWVASVGARLAVCLIKALLWNCAMFVA